MNFGERIQQILIELDISQSELARRLGATSQSVSGWCSSGIIPREKILDKLEEATGKPLFWFFMSQEEENSYNAALNGVTDLSDDERKLLDVYRKFPSVERKNMIATFEARLTEIDEYFKELAKLKGINLDNK